MEAKKINKIIKDYNELYNLAIFKIQLLEKIDSKYNTGNSIEEINFYE